MEAAKQSTLIDFTVHDKIRGLACSLPSIGAYQEQKQIKVVTSAPLNFGQASIEAQVETSTVFFDIRLKAALNQNTDELPSYFPGKTIPGQGGAGCHEVMRGNLLFDQFCYMLSFDKKACARLLDASAKYSLYSLVIKSDEAWSWSNIAKPTLSFLYQAQENQKDIAQENLQELALKALELAVSKSLALYDSYGELEDLEIALFEIKNAWYQCQLDQPHYHSKALTAVAQLYQSHKAELTGNNLLPFMFELESIASQMSQAESLNLHSFAAGVFADNYVQVSLMPLGAIKATEFCVRERLFDEIINLAGRGFAPVVINEWGLVADGNHRVTAAWIWNILKHTADLTWALDDKQFQFTVSQYIRDCQTKPGNLALSPVSLHEALSHLAAYLKSPEYRSRLLTYVKPLLKNYDYIVELPVVLLSEYLSQAVVKGLYDEGIEIVRACPSLYEEMASDQLLVLPPRASYHFTDAALLPWFKVLSSVSPDSQNDISAVRRIPSSARMRRQNQDTNKIANASSKEVR